MKKFFYTGLVSALVLLQSCGSKSGQTPKTAEQTQKAEPVETLVLGISSIDRDVEYTATLLAWEEIHYAPASPGRIDNIRVEIGQNVKKGELLVEMDRTQLHQAEVQLKTLETDFARIDTLYRAGSIAGQQYDQMRSQLEVLRSNVAFLSGNTRLVAPFNGVVSGKYFESGELYSGAPVAMVGKAAILSIVQIDRLKLTVPVSEKYFPKIKNGMPATVVCDIYPDKRFVGKVFNIYPTVDALSRTFNIEIAIENTDRLLRPGMFSRVTLSLDKEEALLLPANAILKLQGSNDRYLFVEENGTAKRVSVEVGKRFDDKVEVISSQIKAGDKLIVKGQARLLDGMKVEVVKNHTN